MVSVANSRASLPKRGKQGAQTVGPMPRARGQPYRVPAPVSWKAGGLKPVRVYQRSVRVTRPPRTHFLSIYGKDARAWPRPTPRRTLQADIRLTRLPTSAADKSLHQHELKVKRSYKPYGNLPAKNIYRLTNEFPFQFHNQNYRNAAYNEESM